MDYEEYELACERIRKENEKYLTVFYKELQEKNLNAKTIEKHIRNVEFYINEFLLREDANEMVEGCHMLDYFLGYFFIRKCMWSTPASIKSTATSIKKFYKCMFEHHFVKKEDYQELCDDIKYNLEDWQNDCAKFNDPDEDFFFDLE